MNVVNKAGLWCPVMEPFVVHNNTVVREVLRVRFQVTRQFTGLQESDANRANFD